MYLKIEITEKLRELHKKTGKPYEKLINEMVENQLDEKKKKEIFEREFDELIEKYKTKKRVKKIVAI